MTHTRPRLIPPYPSPPTKTPRPEPQTAPPSPKHTGLTAPAPTLICPPPNFPTPPPPLTPQVLLAEKWAAEHPEISFVSCHPGWTDTPGVDAWLGKNKGALRPLRTLWQGTEGIAWLCTCKRDELKVSHLTPPNPLALPYYPPILYPLYPYLPPPSPIRTGPST